MCHPMEIISRFTNGYMDSQAYEDAIEHHGMAEVCKLLSKRTRDWSRDIYGVRVRIYSRQRSDSNSQLLATVSGRPSTPSGRCLLPPPSCLPIVQIVQDTRDRQGRHPVILFFAHNGAQHHREVSGVTIFALVRGIYISSSLLLSLTICNDGVGSAAPFRIFQ